jgi:excisionase family DNA binding protein
MFVTKTNLHSMNNPILTQPSLEEMRQMLREELNTFLSNVPDSINANQPQELLNIAGASKYLNLTPYSIYNLVHRREIPYMKRAKRLYFSKEELRQWVEEGRKPTQATLKATAEMHLAQLIKKRSS